MSGQSHSMGECSLVEWPNEPIEGLPDWENGLDEPIDWSHTKSSIVLAKGYGNVGPDGYAKISISVEPEVQSAATNETLFERSQQTHHGVVAPPTGGLNEEIFIPSSHISFLMNIVSTDGYSEPIQGVEETLMLNREMKYSEDIVASHGGALNLSKHTFDIEYPTPHCTLNNSKDRLVLEYGYQKCNEEFSNFNGLLDHSLKWVSHKSFYCVVPGCDVQLSPHPLTILLHFELMHENLKPHHCTQCYCTFNTWMDLCKHASETHHDAYMCFYMKCGSAFRRSGDLTRHQLSHKDVFRHSCPHCRRRGTNGFKRKDHLTQHIRNYHKIESEEHVSNGTTKFDCPLCPPHAITRTLASLTTHMLQKHESLPYVCSHASCDRVGMNGFGTDKLYKAHIKKEHQNPFQCSFAGCHRIGTNGWMRKVDMVKHMREVHKVMIFNGL